MCVALRPSHMQSTDILCAGLSSFLTLTRFLSGYHISPFLERRETTIIKRGGPCIAFCFAWAPLLAGFGLDWSQDQALGPRFDLELIRHFHFPAAVALNELVSLFWKVQFLIMTPLLFLQATPKSKRSGLRLEPDVLSLGQTDERGFKFKISCRPKHD